MVQGLGFKLEGSGLWEVDPLRVRPDSRFLLRSESHMENDMETQD